MSLCVGFDEELVHAKYPEASMILPEKIWSAPTNKLDKVKECCANGDYLGSLKLDGYFYMLNKTENYVYFFSRSKSTVTKLLTEKIANVPHLAEAAKRLPPDTLLVGEVYIPGKKSSDVTTIMGCLPAKAIARQAANGNLHYYIDDIVTYNGEDMRQKPFQERIAIATEVYDTFLKDIPEISIAIQIDSPNLYEIATGWIAAGEEGMVLRKKTAVYTSDKRPAWASIKIKADDTLDAIITGFEDPTREYAGKELDSWQYFDEEGNPVTKAFYYGWKNRMEISGYDSCGNLIPIGTISSGLTDELRQEFAEHPEKYLNRVVEIRCMSLDKARKTIRHGFFLKFRDDKNPEECILSDMFK